METIKFNNPHFGVGLDVVADISYHTGEHGEYGILNAAYLKMGGQIVEITDHEMLAEIMACKGYFASIESVDNYESEAYT